jgi:hypothetical protein
MTRVWMSLGFHKNPVEYIAKVSGCEPEDVEELDGEEDGVLFYGAGERGYVYKVLPREQKSLVFRLGMR